MNPENYFRRALQLASSAHRKNEVPIGAVIVKDGKIIASSHNGTEKEGNFFAHAELLAMKRASRKLNSKYLLGCELYVTLEPCKMCLAAAQLSRVSRVHFLLKSEKFGTRGPAYWRIVKKQIRIPKAEDSAKELLRSFFLSRRQKKSLS